MKFLILLSLAVAAFAWSDSDRDASFGKIDKDASGYVSIAELRGVFVSFDANQDQIVSQVEFNAAWPAATGMNAMETAGVFAKADNNGNGQIDLPEIDGIFILFDTPAVDGRVTKNEFDAGWVRFFSGN